jgi:CRP-like cAMP-binding protein
MVTSLKADPLKTLALKAHASVSASTAHHPQQNSLLNALPADDLTRLLPNLEWVHLPLGTMLYEPNEQLRYAIFPTTSIVSLHYVTESGASSEIAGVGKEGMLSVSLFMGGNTTPSSAVVQTAGGAYRLDRLILKSEFNRGGVLQKLLLRYTQALMTQISQTSSCNRHHSVEQQLCRWLLLTADRIPGGEFVMTQELVAGMLGVRRESVTQAAGLLQMAGCIHYRRGHMAILNRLGLEQRVCECYGVVKKEMERLMESGL